MHVCSNHWERLVLALTPYVFCWRIAAKRKYSGEMVMVGESVAITGVTLSKDLSLTEDDEDVEIGFFNMIDATKERLGEDKKGVRQTTG